MAERRRRNTSGAWRRVLEHWRREAKKNDGVLTCALCLRPVFVFAYEYPHPESLAIDHKTPHSLGGEDTIGNSQPCHLQPSQVRRLCRWRLAEVD